LRHRWCNTTPRWCATTPAVFGEPFSPAAAGSTSTEDKSVPKSLENAKEQEPIGIVISRGQSSEPSPRFSAYVWGAADDPEEKPVDAKVA